MDADTLSAHIASTPSPRLCTVPRSAGAWPPFLPSVARVTVVQTSPLGASPCCSGDNVASTCPPALITVVNVDQLRPFPPGGRGTGTAARLLSRALSQASSFMLSLTALTEDMPAA